MSEKPDPVDHGSEFDTRFSRYESLREEVLFILNEAIARTPVKTHSVLGRVKDRVSFLEKVSRKGYSAPFDEVQDLVGARIVCLFYDDIPRLSQLIHEEFDVVSEENKIKDAPDDTFGYMSVHFICTLHEHNAGRRYDRVKGLAFEVQIRTILMDAWANVSHHLAYKGEASIPAPLRRDFNALSGLFYVADKQFQSFADGVARAEADALILESMDLPIPIDRGTVRKLFVQMFPHRERVPSSEISEFVEQVVDVGYEDVESLRDAIRCGLDEALDLEHHISVDGSDLADVGLARFALAMSDEAFGNAVYGPVLLFRTDDE